MRSHGSQAEVSAQELDLVRSPLPVDQAVSTVSDAAGEVALPGPSLGLARGSDRRRRRATLVQTLTSRRRRRRFRRVGEARNEYVDHVSPRLAALAVFILIACSLDAFLTLLALDAGAEEANPVMRLAFGGGERFFLAIKMTTTALGVWLLAAHQNFRVAVGGLYLIASAYLVLLAYHSVLLAFVY